MRDTMKRVIHALPVIFFIAGLIHAVPSDTLAETRTINIKGFDNMTYDVEEIKANPGDTLHVILTTKSQLPANAFMSHNWLLLKQDADVKKFANKSEQAKENGYVAPEMEEQIIALTGMAAKDETTETTFVVPEEPGEYEYICTFPGHYRAGMKGSLIVSEDDGEVS